MDTRAADECKAAQLGASDKLTVAKDATIRDVESFVIRGGKTDLARDPNLKGSVDLNSYASICIFQGPFITSAFHADRVAIYQIPDAAGNGIITTWNLSETNK